jgi:GcrA cell cycle regulator
MDWTVEAIERLKLLWTEGLSTAEIGRRLNISKNAVVGKAHRLALVARPSPIRRDPTAAARPRPAVSRRPQGSTLPPLPSASEPVSPDLDAVEPRPDASAAMPPRGETLSGRDRGRPAEAAARSPVPPHADAAAFIAAQPAPVQAPVQAKAAAPEPEDQDSDSVEAEASALSPVAPAIRSVSRPAIAPRMNPRHTACCWPIGEPGTPSFHFCGKDAATGRPYCDAHAEIAYVRVRDRRDNAA